MATLVRVAADLRAIVAAQVSLKFMDGRYLRPADDVQGYGLMSVASQAPDLQVAVAGIECVTGAIL